MIIRGLTNKLCCVLSSKSKLAVVDIIIRLPPDTEDVAMMQIYCATL